MILGLLPPRAACFDTRLSVKGKKKRDRQPPGHVRRAVWTSLILGVDVTGTYPRKHVRARNKLSCSYTKPLVPRRRGRKGWAKEPLCLQSGDEGVLRAKEDYP
jgi:hypothetical protein